MDKFFVSVDWGTSNFRLRLVERNTLQIVEEVTSVSGGIKRLFEKCKKNGCDKETFFLNFLQLHVQRLTKAFQSNTPVVISGMASSNIGLKELPYACLPFCSNGEDVVAKWLPSSSHFKYDILLISGIRNKSDVTRGEETQFIGFLPYNRSFQNCIIIFPGTHSKHFIVKDNKLQNFKTYMTGEYFEFLCTKSLLSSSVIRNKEINTPSAQKAFKEGVNLSAAGNILNTSFVVRTNSLFNKFKPKDNFHFLSGLLIGTELTSLSIENIVEIYFVGEPGLNRRYQMALDILGKATKNVNIDCELQGLATVRGQAKILNIFKKNI